MASTSVHLPPEIVEALDRVAAERGTSRNRVILQACEQLLAEHRGDWPEGFFASELGPQDLEALRTGGRELEAEIRALRRERPVAPL